MHVHISIVQKHGGMVTDGLRGHSPSVPHDFKVLCLSRAEVRSSRGYSFSDFDSLRFNAGIRAN